jgi:beta-N-acetylglucosaminidase
MLQSHPCFVDSLQLIQQYVFDYCICMFNVVDDLKQLIAAADKCHINFVYALSPGLDIVYSSVKDMDALKAKLNQV